MKQFQILASTSFCQQKENRDRYSRCLSRNISAFYHEDYQGGARRHEIAGTIEYLICTFKNDVRPYSRYRLEDVINHLTKILNADFPEILRQCNYQSLRVCVVPRAKRENYYRDDQKLFRSTIQNVVQNTQGFEDGTHDIIRHTDTATTHLARSGHGGIGCQPYVGITLDTCNFSDNVKNQNILLIDDLYTKTVNIDEDCIQALLDKGANNVLFYSIGKTMSRR